MNFLFHRILSNRAVFFFISGSLTTGPESWIVPRISLRTRGRRRKQKTYWISVKSTSLVVRPSCRGCSPERLSRRKSEPKKSTEPDMKSDPKRGQMLWERCYAFKHVMTNLLKVHSENGTKSWWSSPFRDTLFETLYDGMIYCKVEKYKKVHTRIFNLAWIRFHFLLNVWRSNWFK